jgi:hypothetical protein
MAPTRVAPVTGASERAAGKRGMQVAQVRWERGRSGNPRLVGDPGPEVSYSP